MTLLLIHEMRRDPTWNPMIQHAVELSNPLFSELPRIKNLRHMPIANFNLVYTDFWLASMSLRSVHGRAHQV